MRQKVGSCVKIDSFLKFRVTVDSLEVGNDITRAVGNDIASAPISEALRQGLKHETRAQATAINMATFSIPD